MKWLRKLWHWLTGRRRMKSGTYYIPISRIVRSPKGVRRTAGVRVGIRRALTKSRAPKPAKRRQRDIDKEYLKRVKAKRAQVA